MKRVTAIILAMIILFTSFIPVVATENSTVHTENKKVQWLVENNFLVGRGKSRDLKLGSSITRAEFTRMALVAKGEEDASKEYPNVSTKFKDVDENHWAVKLISYASEKGYISGYPDGNFKPEGDITYEEIISILARIHPNYTKIETKSNGWAEGFIKFATENGILEGLKIESSYKSPAIREKTFEMIYNFINIENNYAKETKSTKPIETKNENYFGWNGFYPYWFQFGYRPRAEKPVEPEVKPEPETPDVKPEPEEPKEPETPEKPKEFDKENIAKIEVKNQPNLTYTEGDKLDLMGLVVTLTDNQELTKDVEFKDFKEYGLMTDPTSETQLTADRNGTKIKITKGNLETETNALTVNEKVFDPENVETITVKTQPKLNYTEGEKLDLSKLVVILKDNQDLTKEIEFKDFKEYGITTSPTNEKPLTMDDNGKEIVISKGEAKAATEALTVNPKVFDKENIVKIEVISQPSNVNYTEGETLDLTGLRVELTDNQGLTEEIGLDKFEDYGITTSPTNGTPLTVDHNGKSVVISKDSLEAETEALTVKEKVFDPEHVETITVKTQPKLNYTEGEKLDLSKLVVILKDNQDLTKEISLDKFGEYGITTSPENGAELKLSDNAKTVVISKGTVTVETEALKVNPKVFDPEHVETITVKTQPKLNYTEGDKLDLTGLVVTLTDNQGLTEEIVLDKFGEYGITTSPTIGTPLTVDHNGKSVVISKDEAKAETDPLTVKFFDKDNITKIEVITQPKLEYFEREFLDLTGLKVRLTDNKGATKEVEFKDFNEYGIKTRPSNDRQLLMDSYKEVEIYKGTIKTTTAPLIIEKRVFDINLLKSIIISIPKDLSFNKGENLNLVDLRVTLLDSNYATEKLGITGIIAKGYKFEITPSDGTVLGIEHNKKPIIVEVEGVQGKSDPIYVNIKINFMQAEDNVYSTKIIQPYTKVDRPDNPKREGYKFMGWYTDLTFETPFDFDKILDDNMEVYAKWEAI